MRGSSQRCANDGSTVTRSRCAVAARRGRRGLHAFVELRQRALHAAQQRLARGIEHDAPPAPLEQREAQLLLEAADLLAHRAVREVQRLGGGAQVLQPRGGTKGRQILQRESGKTRHAGKHSRPRWEEMIDSVPAVG